LHFDLLRYRKIKISKDRRQNEGAKLQSELITNRKNAWLQLEMDGNKDVEVCIFIYLIFIIIIIIFLSRLIKSLMKI